MSDEEKLREITHLANAINRLIEGGHIINAVMTVGYSNESGEHFITIFDASDNKFKGLTIDKILEKYDK